MWVKGCSGIEENESNVVKASKEATQGDKWKDLILYRDMINSIK